MNPDPPTKKLTPIGPSKNLLVYELYQSFLITAFSFIIMLIYKKVTGKRVTSEDSLESATKMFLLTSSSMMFINYAEYKGWIPKDM